MMKARVSKKTPSQTSLVLSMGRMTVLGLNKNTVSVFFSIQNKLWDNISTNLDQCYYASSQGDRHHRWRVATALLLLWWVLFVFLLSDVLCAALLPPSGLKVLSLLLDLVFFCSLTKTDTVL